ncbi:hypothetical protein LINGRAHAP2_LOCUS9326 [Linum grandiflorum]
MPMNLLAPIYEDPIRPFFPRDAYNVVPAASLRPLHVSPTMCSDIIGRLVSITDPILSVEEGSLSFTVVLDDPGFSHNHLPISLVSPTNSRCIPLCEGSSCKGFLWPRYAVVVRCADATVGVIFLFREHASILLFKMRPDKFAELSFTETQELLNSVRDRLFIIEARSLGLNTSGRAHYEVTHLWDPVAAYY